MAKILVIDDQIIIRKTLKFTLEKLGHDVITAEDGREGLDLFVKESPDIMLIDIILPRMNGIDVLKKMREKSSETEAIMITGEAGMETAINALREGAFDYFQKPVDYGKLKNSINNALKKLGSQRLLKKYVNDLKKVVNEKDEEISMRAKAERELTLSNEKLQEEIAKRKQLEQSAKLAALGKLAAGVAHEINNPLSFIHANLTNLKKFCNKIIKLIEGYNDLNISEETKTVIERNKFEINYAYLKSRIINMIDASITGTDRMKKIVMDMKTFTRVDMAEVANANINESLDTTIGILIHEYKNRIEIKREYDKQLPQVRCFVAKLNQVFLNLLVNACQAIEGKGLISVRTRAEGDKVVIEIEDNGCGIPDDVKDKILNPFFTTKPIGQGTGLGLSITHEIIEQHNGELYIESKQGEGALFTIKIPAFLKSK